jgi:hypothetical protein
MLNNLNLSPSSKLDPSIYAFDKVSEYIQLKTYNKSDAINLIEAIQRLCLTDEILSDYLGDVFKVNANRKLRNLYNKILSSHKKRLGIVNASPAVIFWKHQKDCKCDSCFERESDLCDSCDSQNPFPDGKKNFHTKWFDKVASNELKTKKQKGSHKKKKSNPSEVKK